MAAILVNYVATDANTGVTVNLTGMLSYADRGVGGGPVFPPSDAHPEHPIVIPKPPSDAHPEHPIYHPEHPAHPIELPHPEHPIALPPTEPPTNPPNPSWVWGFNPTQGWLPVYVPGPTDPQPH